MTSRPSRSDARATISARRQRDAPRVALAAQRDRVPFVAVGKDQRDPVRAAVGPERVDGVPWRMRIARRGRRGRALGDERLHLGKRRGEQRTRRRRRSRREQRCLISRDQAGIDVAGGEGVVGDDAAQERDVRRHADDLVVGERIAKAARARRSDPRRGRSSFAIIGS